ncbi:MAG: hypothetical protein ACRD26_10870 [Vicinamibacterales bacterium]
MLKAVEQQTDGSIRLSTGTLYGIIGRLPADGLIAERTTRVQLTRSPGASDAKRREVGNGPLQQPAEIDNGCLRAVSDADHERQRALRILGDRQK